MSTSAHLSQTLSQLQPILAQADAFALERMRAEAQIEECRRQMVEAKERLTALIDEAAEATGLPRAAVKRIFEGRASVVADALMAKPGRVTKSGRRKADPENKNETTQPAETEAAPETADNEMTRSVEPGPAPENATENEAEPEETAQPAKGETASEETAQPAEDETVATKNHAAQEESLPARRHHESFNPDDEMSAEDVAQMDAELAGIALPEDDTFFEVTDELPAFVKRQEEAA